MGLRIFIDDEREPWFSDGLVHAEDEVYRTADEALLALTKVWIWQQQVRDHMVIEELSLDHDLGEGGTIKPVVEFLLYVAEAGRPMRINRLVIHSCNPVGSVFMADVLSKYYSVEKRLGGFRRP